MQLKIDKEFRELLPTQSLEEGEELERSLLAEGCREPIIATAQGTIIDGMTRWVICEKHGIPYKTITREFASRKEARIWILRTQLGRRNLTDAERISVAEKLVKESFGGTCTPGKTAENIGKIANVSEKTVKSFIRADASPVKELGRMMKAGEISIRAAGEVATLPPKKQEVLIIRGPSAVKAAAAEIRNGHPVTIKAPEKNSPFPDSTLIDDTLSALARLKGNLVALLGSADAAQSGDPCGFHLHNHRQEYLGQLDTIRHALKTSRPYAVCPYCEGKGRKCEGCKGCGWVGRSIYDGAPREMKASVKHSIED